MDYFKVYFAETMNEYYYLFIMEFLGGVEFWKDWFVV